MSAGRGNPLSQPAPYDYTNQPNRRRSVRSESVTNQAGKLGQLADTHLAGKSSEDAPADEVRDGHRDERGLRGQPELRGQQARGDVGGDAPQHGGGSEPREG